jgi:hypothetical protein
LAQEEEVRYERNPDYIYRSVVGEAVLVPVRQNAGDMDCIYTLNPVGALVWEKLATPTTEVELQQAILDEFESDRETVTADLLRFLEQLETAGAIRRA